MQSRQGAERRVLQSDGHRNDQGVRRYVKKISRKRVNTLVEQVRSGDARAFNRLVAELEPFVKGSAMKVCRDPATADETTQDTLIAMYRKLHQFDNSSLFCTWIYSIVVNNCRMKRRRRKIDRSSMSIETAIEHHGEDAHGASASPETRMLAEELRRVIGSAVDALPEDYRAVFVLRDLEHLSTEQTAAALDLTEAAVKSRLHRARGKVKGHMQRYLA